jgi:hypothetical protein
MFMFSGGMGLSILVLLFGAFMGFFEIMLLGGIFKHIG